MLALCRRPAVHTCLLYELMLNPRLLPRLLPCLAALQLPGKEPRFSDLALLVQGGIDVPATLPPAPALSLAELQGRGEQGRGQGQSICVCACLRVSE